MLLNSSGIPAEGTQLVSPGIILPRPAGGSGKRDPGIQDLVDHFDDLSGRHKDWDNLSTEERFSLLKAKEVEAIQEQFEVCASDFAYAARNYFWITDKYGEDRLFTLWESQWLVLQKFYELKRKGKAQKIMILKARQLGMSLLIEALIAWRTMFFPNTNALVVSVDADHSGYLFSLMLHIYDMMPWWLRPERASRKEEEGLWFDRLDPDQRRTNPGMNSRIYVQHSNQMSGVGQGRRISAGHVSEYTDFIQKRAEEIIEGDLLHAIHDNPENFCFLESTGRGAGSYSHQLWKSCEKMAERAEWYPLFLPWFFEQSRRDYSVPTQWRPEKPEAMMRERVKNEWVRCDDPACGQYHPGAIHGESRVGTLCPSCDRGHLQSVVLDNAQLYWKEGKRKNAEAKGKEALKNHKAEMTTTAEEAWQLSGISVFDETTQEAASFTLRDPKKVAGVKVGFIDPHGRFHGVKGERGCWVDGCQEDHRFSDETMTIWEDPRPGCLYAVGVDIAEGIGEDYSVVSVIRLGQYGGPDEQVACFRSNEVEPYDLAFFCSAIGRMYNDALMCIEYNTFRTTGDRVRIDYQYPNLFRWLNLESINPLTNKWHWYTQYNTKPLLWQTARKWIKSGTFIVRDPRLYEEMQTFQKDEDDSKSASHEKGSHDDILMATMIALYCAHALEADPAGRIPVPKLQESQDPPRYRMYCLSCGFGSKLGADGKYPWGVANPEEECRCPNCSSIQIAGAPIETPDPRVLDHERMMALLQTAKDRAYGSALERIVDAAGRTPQGSAPDLTVFQPQEGALLPRRGGEPGADYY